MNMKEEIRKKISTLPPDNEIKQLACYNSTESIDELQSELNEIEKRIKLKRRKEESITNLLERKKQIQTELSKELNAYEQVSCNNVKLESIMTQKEYVEEHSAMNKRYGVTILLFVLGMILFVFVLMYFGYSTYNIWNYSYYGYDIVDFISLTLFLLFIALIVIYTRREERQ